MGNSEGSSIIACGYSDGIIELWDITEMKIIKELNNTSYNAIKFINFLNEDSLISCSENGVLHFWWTRTSVAIKSLTAYPAASAECIATYFYQDRPFLVIPRYNPDKNLILVTWDILNYDTFESTKSFQNISSLSSIYSNDLPYLVLVNGNTKVLNISTFTEVTCILDELNASALHPFKANGTAYLPCIKSSNNVDTKLYPPTLSFTPREYSVSHNIYLWYNNDE